MTTKEEPTIVSIQELDDTEQRTHQKEANGQNMLAMARDAGIEMTENNQDPGQYRGVCPFHNPPIATFAIYVQNGRFNCIYCHQTGGIASLAANLWKVSTNDALRGLRHLRNKPSGHRPRPRNTPANPNSAVINRLMVHFNRDMAINHHAANICARLALNPTKLADEKIGWCWPGRPMDELLRQNITKQELQTSDLLTLGENGSWTTTMPSGFVIPDLDRNRLATNLIGYDTFRGEAYFPSRRRPATIGAERLPNQPAVVHVVSNLLVYLKALELGLATILTCDNRAIKQASQAIDEKKPQAISFYIGNRRAADQLAENINAPTLEPDEALSYFQHMLPRRIKDLTKRPKPNNQEKNDGHPRKAVPHRTRQRAAADQRRPSSVTQNSS